MSGNIIIVQWGLAILYIRPIRTREQCPAVELPTTPHGRNNLDSLLSIHLSGPRLVQKFPNHNKTS
uniref:Uncharacterized protein n=1 Tax=Physcomitrium patens TaxID=3218 RepID=A0A2K1IN64_PHYPA|nr:hypothetical protein PHYPA_027038 [Physcomitrium patens]